MLVLHSSVLLKAVRFKNECFIHHASLTLQWTPLLLVVSMFACENTQRVALGLQYFNAAINLSEH